MTEPPSDEPAHDVLAAEEFGVPAPDPALHHEPPHDVLAAEEFPVPAPELPERQRRGVPWAAWAGALVLAAALTRHRRRG